MPAYIYIGKLKVEVVHLFRKINSLINSEQTRAGNSPTVRK